MTLRISGFLIVGHLIFLGNSVSLFGQTERQIDIEANIKALLRGDLAKMHPWFGKDGGFSLDAAYEFAKKMENNSLEWLISPEGKEMLEKATPEGWPKIDGEEAVRLRKITLEYLVDGFVALALTRDPKAGAEVWLKLPLATRESICRLVPVQTDRFRNLGFHLPMDEELTRHLANQAFKKAVGRDSFVWDRFVGLRTLVLASAYDENRERFIQILADLLREDPMDFNRLSLLVNCVDHFPEDEKRIIKKEMASYLAKALLILESVDRSNIYRDEFKESFKNSIDRFKKIGILRE